MRNTNNSSANNFASGLLFVGFVVLAVLKLAGIIDWSWWIITFPIYVQLLVLIGVMVIAGAIWVIGSIIILIASIFPKKKKEERWF